MNRSSIILSGVMLFLMSFSAYAFAEQGIPGPPLAQSLVREGTLAMNLVHAFRLGSPTSEAESENILSGVGIAPRNGWIADYPVTPDVVIDLRKAVGIAADANRMTMSREEALQIFYNVTKDYELPIQAASTGPMVSPVTPPMLVPPEQTVINAYYTQEGPPVVTYYAPPAAYSYLYNYVPYPFWWSNVWLPGYYMLADFSLVALGFGSWYHGYWPDYGYGYWGGYGRYGYWGAYGYGYWWGGHDHFYGHHDGYNGDSHNGHGWHGGDRHVVSNHYRNRDTGATHRIDPVNRTHGGINDRNRAGGERWAQKGTERRSGANNPNMTRSTGSNRETWNTRAVYNGSSSIGSASRGSYNTDLATNKGNNRQSWNDRTAYSGRYNRGSDNAGRAYTSSSRSYSAGSSYRQPAQRISSQTRQSAYSSGGGRASNASYSTGRGQYSIGGRSSGVGGRGGRSFSGGRASGGGHEGRRS